MSLAEGTRLGAYEIIGKIGAGGMGEVYRATDTKLGREVAIKTLPVGLADDPDRLARFEREAKLLASLNHAHIASVHSLDEHEGTLYIAMELVEGQTLEESLKTGPLSVDDSLRIALQIASALEAAHEKGVVHRDLKPANVMVTADGVVKVLDFGLAKAFSGDPTEASPGQSPALSMAMTQQGIILGTAGYMSPEQASAQATDQRADVWAFGVVLCEMLTGQALFSGESVAHILGGVLRLDPDWDQLPDSLDPRLQRVLERCLKKRPRERYHAIADVRIDIEEILREPAGAAAASVAQMEAVSASGFRRLGLPIATLAIGAAIAGVAVWAFKPDAPASVTRIVNPLPEAQSFTHLGQVTLDISPDGERIVYVANRQLYLRDLDQWDARPIPGTAENPVFPFFSPDGQWIGYYSEDTGQLKKVAITGGAPVPITRSENFLGSPSWGTDDRIIWSSVNGVMVVSANGGLAETLYAPDGSASAIAISPHLLPDGKTLLVHLSDDYLGGDVAIKSLQMGEEKVLLEGASPAYLPTGHIVYWRDGVLFAVPFDLATLELAGGPVSLVEGVRGDPAQYALSDAGDLAYIPGIAARPERVLALVDPDGRVERLNVPPKPYTSPRISPDGQTLLVESIEEDGSVIWSYDMNGDRAIQQLTFDGDNQRPGWTRDGERITFSSDRDGTMSLYWMPADGSGVPERLTTAEEGTSHWLGSWSSDNETLVYSIQRVLGTDWDIAMLSLADGSSEVIYDAPNQAYYGAELSRDGNFLTYAMGPYASSLDIFVERFPPTGVPRRITAMGGYWPVWSIDGDELIYRPVSSTTGITLRSVDIATEPTISFSNEQTHPVRGFEVVGYHRDYDPMPDGERLVMVFPFEERAQDNNHQQINIVKNWAQEVVERVPVD